MTLITGGVAQPVAPKGWHLDGYRFDAWLHLHHGNSIVVTQHPVEYGANISDHAFVQPRRWSFDIGMSDTVADTVNSQFPANPTRSVNAYGIINNLQRTRLPLVLGTKYGQYANVLIENFDAADSSQTQNMMKATISLVEIIVATTSQIKISINPQATNSTSRGNVSSPQLGTLSAIKQDIQRLTPRFASSILGVLGL